MKKLLVCVFSLLCLSACHKKSMRVAILDSGISEVNGNVITGYNYIDGTKDTTDDKGHGSMLAEIILSAAPDCTLVPLKVSCEDRRVNDYAIEAIQDCMDTYDVDIICMAFSIMESEELHDVIQRADDKGIVMVAAAGNVGNRKDTLFPAGYEEVISVGALDSDGNPASYSMVTGVDLFVDGSWKQAQGTSVACAKVAGMFASGKYHTRQEVQK